jgi:hypothetical protein
LTEPEPCRGDGFADADRRTVLIDKPKWQEAVMEPCEVCLVVEAFGLMQLRTEDGHLLAEWWTCCDCADRDAPRHVERGLSVSVIGMLSDIW